MNAYQKSVELGLTGTPQEIVDQLIVSGLTASPVNRGSGSVSADSFGPESTLRKF